MDFFHAAVMRTLLVVIHSFIYLFLFFYLCIQHTYCMLTCYFYTKYVLFVIYVHVSFIQHMYIVYCFIVIFGIFRVNTRPIPLLFYR